jgi:cytochrome b6-f complex iron-sulfur subunit
MAIRSRRNFLKLSTKSLLAACGILGLDGLRRFLSYSGHPLPTTHFELGAVSDFPPGSRTVIPRVPAILIHGANGFSALSLVCPHLGCTVKEGTDDFVCPCHGSRFDLVGGVQQAPASSALRMLRVEVSSDNLVHLYLSEQT